LQPAPWKCIMQFLSLFKKFPGLHPWVYWLKMPAKLLVNLSFLYSKCSPCVYRHTRLLQPVHAQPRTQGITFAHPLLRKYPGAGWSRGSQILGAKINCYSGRGGTAMICYVLNVFVNL
jgi:hypothetical protein